jgi:hypothetical protein
MFGLFFRVFLLRGPIRKSGSWHSAAIVDAATSSSLVHLFHLISFRICVEVSSSCVGCRVLWSVLLDGVSGEGTRTCVPQSCCRYVNGRRPSGRGIYLQTLAAGTSLLSTTRVGWLSHTCRQQKQLLCRRWKRRTDMYQAILHRNTYIIRRSRQRPHRWS